jgi:hypothetical protein
MIEPVPIINSGRLTPGAKRARQNHSNCAWHIKRALDPTASRWNNPEVGQFDERWWADGDEITNS